MQKRGGCFDFEKKKEKIIELEAEISQKDFWRDNKNAKIKSQELDGLKEEIEQWEKIKKEVDDLLEIANLDEDDQNVNLREDIESKFNELKKQFERFEFFILFNQKYDKNNAILSIYAGAGGDDAQDWAEMLLNMYLKFCQKKKWGVKILDQSKGGEAGIKSATLEIKGKYVYGYLKAEAGVHRLVRISPFDAERMRHTSFALVEVLPELEELEEKEIEINSKDLRIDTFLASGHGGQSVQTTYSAVRLVHLPTKISVSCQNERSQRQNKEKALKVLKAKLFQYEQEHKDEERKKIKGEFKSAEWGNQIRSYVLHPYHLVKDHRTNYETKNPKDVLEGGLEDFIEAYLKKNKLAF
ncbi:MAG: peptide chain release factor 2 [Parcubacteria group bacterium Athens1014_10]|nr:MAG: peptide chain release factor 2 [Parcubacteria group bacterium Athens1014_10]TSD06107.1 MAG: peptide chain release factor 2 [Parcubacteria group bacterium Athens0714_12]